MAEYIIDKIEYGENVYKLQDSVSDFLTGAVTSLSTTAGQHTTITDQNGAVSIAIPISTSHLTNDSGFITNADMIANIYTNTISAVGTSASNGTSNKFARGDHVHNITKATINSVLETGSGTAKFYREDGTWAIPAITDTKLQITPVTNGITYYPIVAANSTTAAIRQYDAMGISYTGTNGTANDTDGNAVLTLGNAIASTTADWKKGTIRLYGTNIHYIDLVSGAPSTEQTITFPDKSGTVALLSDIPDIPDDHPVTSVNGKTGVIVLDATDVGALSNSTVYVSKVSTTAGAHTTISNQSGAISIVIPTKTSHLTNDSGYITSHQTVTNKAATLAFGTTTTIATIGGTDITVTMPTAPSSTVVWA